MKLLKTKLNEKNLIQIMEIFGYEFESKNHGQYRYVFKGHTGNQFEIYINEMQLESLLKAIYNELNNN